MFGHGCGGDLSLGVCNVSVFLLVLRIWGYRKWVIWREFSRELRTSPRPPWLTSNLGANPARDGGDKYSLKVTGCIWEHRQWGRRQVFGESWIFYPSAEEVIVMLWTRYICVRVRACCQNGSRESWWKCGGKSRIFTTTKKKPFLS